MADLRFVRTVDPVDEPVTLQEARDQVRVDDELEDALLSEYIAAARDYCERVTGLPLMRQTFTLYADKFKEVFELKPNLISVTSVKYIDRDGALQTVTDQDYEVSVADVLGVVYPAFDKRWPETRQQRNAVQIEFVCGFADRTKVPDTIRSAMKLLIAHWFNNREAVIIGTISSNLPIGVDHLLGVNKVWRV